MSVAFPVKMKISIDFTASNIGAVTLLVTHWRMRTLYQLFPCHVYKAKYRGGGGRGSCFNQIESRYLRS